MFRRLNLIKSGRDGAVYGEKVIILNTFFCSLNNVSSLVGELFAQTIFPKFAWGELVAIHQQ